MAYTGVNRPLLLFSDPISGPPAVRALPRLQMSRDLSEIGGDGRIAGTVKVDSTPDYPVWRRVRLFAKRDGRLVREMWSDPVTGAYAFDYINRALQYVVIAHDHTGAYQAVVSDTPTVDPMP